MYFEIIFFFVLKNEAFLLGFIISHLWFAEEDTTLWFKSIESLLDRKYTSGIVISAYT